MIFIAIIVRKRDGLSKDKATKREELRKTVRAGVKQIWRRRPFSVTRLEERAQIVARAEAEAKKALAAENEDQEEMVKLPEGKLSTSETLNSRADEGLISLLKIMEELGVPLAKSGIYLPDGNGGPYRHTQVTPGKMLELRRSADMIRHLIRTNEIEGDILEKVGEGLRSDDPIIRRGATNIIIEIVLDEGLFKDIPGSADKEDGRENAIGLLIDSSEGVEECKGALEELGYSKKKMEELTAKPDRILSLAFWKPRKGDGRRISFYSTVSTVAAVAAFATGNMELGLVLLPSGPAVGLVDRPLGMIQDRIIRKIFGSDKRVKKAQLQTALDSVDEFKVIPRHGSADPSTEEVTDETKAMKDEILSRVTEEGTAKAKLELVRDKEKD